MWTKMGPVWLLKSPPPPPPGPHLAKDVKTFFDKNVHQITYIFYILLSFGVILRCLWGLEAYIYNVYEFCWPMYADLGRPGDTFAVAATEQSSFWWIFVCLPHVNEWEFLTWVLMEIKKIVQWYNSSGRNLEEYVVYRGHL